MTGGRATGVRAGGRHRAPAGQVVLAAGCWSARSPACPGGAGRRCGRSRGRSSGWRCRTCAGRSVPHGARRGPRQPGLLRAPRARRTGRRRDRRGAGLRHAVTAGGVYELLRDARELVPGRRAGAGETRAGLRPGTPDNAPMIGAHRAARPGRAPPATTATACCSPRSPRTASPSPGHRARSRRRGPRSALAGSRGSAERRVEHDHASSSVNGEASQIAEGDPLGDRSSRSSSRPGTAPGARRGGQRRRRTARRMGLRRLGPATGSRS